MMALTQDRRKRGYELVKRCAAKFGINVTVCACKNHDIADIEDAVGRCNISGPPIANKRPAPVGSSSISEYFVPKKCKKETQ
jgi:hypothetical protein